MQQTVIAVGLGEDLQTALARTCHSQEVKLEHLSWSEWFAAQIHAQLKGERATLYLARSYGVTIQVEEAVGLISFDRCVPRAHWKGAPQDDQDYLYSARQSAWLVMHAIARRAINQLDHTILQAHFLTLPHCYSVAADVGIAVPQWAFSSRGKESHKGLTTNNHTLDSTHNFSKSDRAGLLTVDFIEGQPIVALVVGGRMFAVNVLSKEICPIPEDIQCKLKILRKRLVLDVIEVFFKVRHGAWVLHRISIRPEWERWWYSQLEAVCEQLLTLLRSTQTEKNIPEKKLFIARHLRPQVGY